MDIMCLCIYLQHAPLAPHIHILVYCYISDEPDQVFFKIGFWKYSVSVSIVDDFSKELWKLIKIAKIHVQLTFNSFLSLISGHKWPNLEDRVNSFTTTISEWQKFKLEINYGNLILSRLTRFLWQGKTALYGIRTMWFIV